MKDNRLMIKAHEIKLYPTKSQELLFRKSCGVARFTYNWALNKREQDYKEGITWSVYGLIKHLNAIKKEEFPWMLEVSKTCCQYPIHNLEKAYKSMWEGGGKHPVFKRRAPNDSFVAIENRTKFKDYGFKIHIPRVGKVRCAENLRFEGKVNNVVVKRVANIWFAVVNIEVAEKPIDIPVVRENQTTVGIDMGIKTMLVLSDGTAYENPKALKSNLKSLKRLQRGLSRKVKGSKNRERQKMRVARKHYRISCIRSNAIHQATTEIVRNYDNIVIETLRPRNMVKNHNLAQAVGDVSFGEIARQLTYKVKWAGKELVKADQWYPSSKLCSCYGHKKETLKLSERTYNCDNCGLSMDRDLNAAKNLAKYSPTQKFGGSEACGEVVELVMVQSGSVKHEENSLTIKHL